MSQNPIIPNIWFNFNSPLVQDAERYTHYNFYVYRSSIYIPFGNFFETGITMYKSPNGGATWSTIDTSGSWRPHGGAGFGDSQFGLMEHSFGQSSEMIALVANTFTGATPSSMAIYTFDMSQDKWISTSTSAPSNIGGHALVQRSGSKEFLIESRIGNVTPNILTGLMVYTSSSGTWTTIFSSPVTGSDTYWPHGMAIDTNDTVHIAMGYAPSGILGSSVVHIATIDKNNSFAINSNVFTSHFKVTNQGPYIGRPLVEGTVVRWPYYQSDYAGMYLPAILSGSAVGASSAWSVEAHFNSQEFTNANPPSFNDWGLAKGPSGNRYLFYTTGVSNSYGPSNRVSLFRQINGSNWDTVNPIVLTKLERVGSIDPHLETIFNYTNITPLDGFYNGLSNTDVFGVWGGSEFPGSGGHAFYMMFYLDQPYAYVETLSEY